MQIPIFNTLLLDDNKNLKSKKIDIKILNNLSLNKPNPKMFPMINLLKYLPKKNSLFETVIVSANDTLVELFLKHEIRFIDIQKELFKILDLKEFNKYRKIYPQKVNDILELNHYVRLKILKKVYKSSDVQEFN
jgi:1-deoxy-D-xylulose-5-phosphate reductoisomerase